MKLKDILTMAGSVAGVASASALGGPGAGLIVSSALGGGGLFKKFGKAIEDKTGIAVHKVGSPLVAIALPQAAVNALPPEWMEKAFTIFAGACEDQEHTKSIATLVWSLAAIVWYQLSNGSGKLVSRD